MWYSFWLTCTIQHFEIILHKRADFVVSIYPLGSLITISYPWQIQYSMHVLNAN